MRSRVATYGPREIGHTGVIVEDNGDVLTLTSRGRRANLTVKVNRGRRAVDCDGASGGSTRYPYEQIRALDVTIRHWPVRRLFASEAEFALELRSGTRVAVCTGPTNDVLTARALVAGAMGLDPTKEQIIVPPSPSPAMSVRPPEAPVEVAAEIASSLAERERRRRGAIGYAAAWQSLLLREIAAVASFLIGAGLTVALIAAAGPRGRDVSPLMFAPVVLGVAASRAWLDEFRCPRCGDRFFSQGSRRDSFARACVICGLSRGAKEDAR